MEPPIPPARETDEELPPFLGRWSRVYAAVLWYLLLLICALYAVTRIYRS